MGVAGENGLELGASEVGVVVGEEEFGHGEKMLGIGRTGGSGRV